MLVLCLVVFIVFSDFRVASASLLFGWLLEFLAFGPEGQGVGVRVVTMC